MEYYLRPGTIIKFKRSYYSHYGVYYKRNKVVHFNGTLEEKKGSSVEISNLCEISGEPCIVKDRYYNLEPMKSIEVIDRCNTMLGTEGYNVLWNNCEHMATYIRYGKKVSKQVKDLYFFIFLLSFLLLNYTKL